MMLETSGCEYGSRLGTDVVFERGAKRRDTRQTNQHQQSTHFSAVQKAGRARRDHALLHIMLKICGPRCFNELLSVLRHATHGVRSLIPKVQLATLNDPQDKVNNPNDSRMKPRGIQGEKRETTPNSSRRRLLHSNHLGNLQL